MFSKFTVSMLGVLGWLLVIPSAGAQEPWAVPGATMRFKVEINSSPSSPDAGVIAEIPNGGALPGPFPNAVVIDSGGKQVHSECIWNNPQEGCAIIFPEAPGPLWIYLEGGSIPSNPWTTDSQLHPSLLLYTRSGNASLAEAHNVAAENPPGQSARMGQVPMIADAQNRFGPSNDFVSYYSGWLNVPEAGDVFIGTISHDGSTVLVDGRTAADWPGLHPAAEGRRGDKGTTIQLTKGPHHVEYFQFVSEGSPMSQLIWRLPSMGKTALPETPRDGDFEHSGSTRIVAGESRAGAPPALFNRTALSYMNFANEFVDLFELSVPPSDQYGGATFAWNFSDGSRGQGADLLWPVLRGTTLSVTLTVSGSRGTSSSTRLIYPDTLPRGARVNDPNARREYAQALLNRLEGARAGARPGSGLPPAFWEMLPQVIEGGEARDLLAFLFQHCGADLGNLSDDDRKRLGNIYYDEVKEDQNAAPDILRNLIAAQTEPSSRFSWQLKALDFDLFEVGDIAAARQVASGLRVDPFRPGKDEAELKLIALGDIERMAGNIDAATRYYTAAQAANQRSTHPAFTSFSGFDDSQPAATPSKDGMVITASASRDADWRSRAVLENSYYTEVKNLLDKRDLDDARDKLDAWALEFPLSKLGGDYALAEAQYAMKFGDFDRAQRILKAYRTHVELSAELAEVMQVEWNCVVQLRRPEDIRELAADIEKRFPDLPLAKVAARALR